MSSILSGFDSSNIAQNEQLSELEKTYELGDVVPSEEAEKIIDRTDKKFRQGDFVLAFDISVNAYIYAVFEGDISGEGLGYDAGDGILTLTEEANLYKIKDYRSSTFSSETLEESPTHKHKNSHKTVSWSDKKSIRIIKDVKGNPYNEAIHDTKMRADTSTYKHLLKHNAFSKDTRKFLEIEIVKEIVKHHHTFTHELAFVALRIRVLHDDELINEFDKAISKLEAIEKKYRRETNQKAKEHTFEQCQASSTTLRLFLNEIIRRGLEAHIS